MEGGSYKILDIFQWDLYGTSPIILLTVVVVDDDNEDGDGNNKNNINRSMGTYLVSDTMVSAETHLILTKTSGGSSIIILIPPFLSEEIELQSN